MMVKERLITLQSSSRRACAEFIVPMVGTANPSNDAIFGALNTQRYRSNILVLSKKKEAGVESYEVRKPKCLGLMVPKANAV